MHVVQRVELIENVNVCLRVHLLVENGLRGRWPEGRVANLVAQTVEIVQTVGDTGRAHGELFSRSRSFLEVRVVR